MPLTIWPSLSGLPPALGPSAYHILVDALVLFHVGFVAFVLLGGLLVLRWRWVAWLHLPAVAWGIIVESFSLYCPLTPWENRLREGAGMAMYEGDFIKHYAERLLYTADAHGQVFGFMSFRLFQALLAVTIVALNLTMYYRAFVVRRRRGARAATFAVAPRPAPAADSLAD